MRQIPKIYRIRLTDSERDDLLRRQRKGSTKSAWHRAASILLLADENAAQGSLADTAIAWAVHATVRTVERIRERAVSEGQFRASLIQPDTACNSVLKRVFKRPSRLSEFCVTI